MTTSFRLGEVRVELHQKAVKHAHLSVHPPEGRVTLVVPEGTRIEVARAFAISKLGWIRDRQSGFRKQAREPERQLLERETHYLWGRRYLLSVLIRDKKPGVTVDHRRITLTVRPGASPEKRAEVLYEWHKALLRDAVTDLVASWEPKLGVRVERVFLQRMKTKWGGCNHRAGNIRLNTELVKKPRDLVEYVVVHEMLHLIEPTHNERFVELLDQHFPAWREARAELNALPLADEMWSVAKHSRSSR